MSKEKTVGALGKEGNAEPRVISVPDSLDPELNLVTSEDSLHWDNPGHDAVTGPMQVITIKS